MATAAGTLDVLGSNILTGLQTALLTSTDWARPNAGSLPNLYKATTTRGAQMCIDLNSVALTLQTMTAAIFRTHDGTTGVDSLTRYIRMKRVSAGSLAANTYHITYSLGKEHFFLGIEGPRPGEASPDSAIYGSIRNYIFMSDLVPYYYDGGAGPDLIPAVVVGGAPSVAAASVAAGFHYGYASRNHLDTVSWVPGHLWAPSEPQGGEASLINKQRTLALDGGKYDVDPFIFVDLVSGRRGRLSSFWHAGWTGLQTLNDVPQPPVGQIIEDPTGGSQNYKLIAVNKSDAAENDFGPLGTALNTSATTSTNSSVIAVPWV